ncbi:MAG: P-loop NTPase, partial [Planctomycetes bacterium]|nr:P-loop NTPase [Planctomycetota bacterium]
MDHDKSKRQTAASACAGSGYAAKASASKESLNALLEQEALEDRMHLIRHKIIVLSGKGGVGKSTVAVNLAVSLSLAGKRVGLLDVDIHGPSIPKMLRLDDTNVQVKDGAIQPVEKAGLKVMSIGFLLQNRDDAVIWRGPMKMNVIKQFLKDVDWGELDY